MESTMHQATGAVDAIVEKPPSSSDSPLPTKTQTSETKAVINGRATEDGRPGGPGRKSRACLECKKLKMKCEVFPGDRKCRHCLRRNVDCIIKRSYTAQIDIDKYPTGSIEGYERKIDAMREEIQHMRQSLDAVLADRPKLLLPIQTQQALLFPEERQAAQTLLTVNQQSHPHQHGALTTAAGTPGSTTSLARLSSREDNMQMAMTRENSLEPIQDDDQGQDPVMVEEPMGSLYEVTRLRNIRSNKAKTARPLPGSRGELNDFISRGVISEPEAEELYEIFHTSLNHYLWVGLEQTHPSFNSVRKSSELLTATILTVTALHIPTSATTFDACYKEFLSLISSSMFSRYHSIDDVRGLCIAAFWLSEVSWKLSGHAIRIATELNIHQSFSRALDGERDHFLRARLWYMLYVCDHHFSIAYGRPPMIAESTQIREHELFLHSPFADALDARILSQVNLMQILTRVYDRFAERRPPGPPASSNGGGGVQGSSGEQIPHVVNGNGNGNVNKNKNNHGVDSAAHMLSDSDFSELRSFNLEIDQWRMRWHARQNPNTFIGTFPPKGIILYSYFAKLQLNSLAVRGVSLASGRLSTERKEFANMAISAAASILTFVLEEDDMRRALVGTPLYVHTMIAFASVFLMKVATRWNRVMGLNVEYGYVSRLLGRMIVLLKSAVTSDRHVLKHIAAGLEKMLERMTVAQEEDEAAAAAALAEEETGQANTSAMMMMGTGTGTGAGTGTGSGTGATATGSGASSIVKGDSQGPVDLATSTYHHMVATNTYQPPETPPALGPPLGSIQMGTTAAWDAAAGGYPSHHSHGQGQGQGAQDFFGDGLTVMNDSLLYEAFGTESANDVYNLLSSQFSY